MNSIELQNLIKNYDAKKILNNINLKINSGEFIVIVGASGCGKSTLLRAIAGLESIDNGNIKINGKSVENLPPKKRDVAMVFQNYALYPHMTVYENMAYGLKMRHFSKAEIEIKINEACEFLQLKDFLERKPNQLSGGQRQRVAIGRAMVRHPKLFLFDEPLSNLDAKLRTEMRRHIKLVHDKLKTTSIYVTHDQVEAMTMADRIVILNNGKIEQVGTPEEIYHHPKTTFVAEFIGSPSLNLWDVENLMGLVSESSQLKTLLANHKDKGIKWIGFRPESVVIVSDQAIFDLAVSVDQQERLGHESNLFTSSNDLMIQPILRVLGDQKYGAGDKINIQFDITGIHVFDELGQRVELGCV